MTTQVPLPASGTQLRQWREALRIRTDELAEAMGTAHSHLREVECECAPLTRKFALRAVRALARLVEKDERETAEIRRLLSVSATRYRTQESQGIS